MWRGLFRATKGTRLVSYSPARQLSTDSSEANNLHDRLKAVLSGSVSRKSGSAGEGQGVAESRGNAPTPSRQSTIPAQSIHWQSPYAESVSQAEAIAQPLTAAEAEEGAAAVTPVVLSDADLHQLARTRVTMRFGRMPKAMMQRMVDAEVRALRTRALDPLAIAEFRRLLASSSTMRARPHPRSRGLCQLSGPEAPALVHEDVNLLSQYISYGGQIKPGRVTGVSAKMQRQLAKTIKRSRQLGFIPYVERLPIPSQAAGGDSNPIMSLPGMGQKSQ